MEHFIVIQASDNGIPQLYSILTIRIIAKTKKTESFAVFKEKTFRFIMFQLC